MFRHLPTLKKAGPNAERNGALNDVPSTEITGEGEQISCHFRSNLTVRAGASDARSGTYDFRDIAIIGPAIGDGF
jgi:hypothetical protein